MSGIYIPGMEMPFCCLVCPCSNTDNTDDDNEVWVCEVSELRQLTTEDKIEHRPEWCPLVRVPPHGRLGDLDALIEAYDFVHVGPPGMARTLMVEAPTIIPAEENSPVYESIKRGLEQAINGETREEETE